MSVTLVLLIVGALVLYAGAEMAVRSTAGVARAVGIPAFLLGAVLFGIDIEGTGAALVAAGRGQTELAAGGIFGAVLFLFSAAFGAALLSAREPVPSPSPFMVVLPALPMAVAALTLFDRFVDRWEGALLLALYGSYVFLVVRHERGAAAESGSRLAAQARPHGRGRLVALLLLGLALLYAGAAALVAGGERMLGSSQLAGGFVGAAVIGVLASLDEVLLEIIPIRRGEPGLATGNLFGTLAAFCSGVLGAAALVHPLDVDGAANAAFLGMAIVYTFVAVVFVLREKAGRVSGAVVLGAYAAWLVVTAAV